MPEKLFERFLLNLPWVSSWMISTYLRRYYNGIVSYSKYWYIFFFFKGPILDVCWHDDGTKVFMASCDKQGMILFGFCRQIAKWSFFTLSFDEKLKKKRVYFANITDILFITVKCWDLASNQTIQVAQHDAPVKVIRWVKAPNYTALMTGSWDKTLKFWDTRSPNPIMSIDLGERCYVADVDFPMAVVGTANRGM